MTIEKFEKEMHLYNLLNEHDKREYDNRVSSVWQAVFDEYYFKCINDAELVSIKEKIMNIESILRYDMKDDFTTYSYTANEGLGGDMEEDIFEYDKEYYNDCKRISENIEQIKAEIKRKIEQFQKRKIMLFKKQEIKKLENELIEKQKTADSFKISQEKEKKKQYYSDNKSALLEPLKEKYNEVIDRYAREVLKKYLESNPEIIVKPNNNIVYSSTHKMNFSPKILNEIFNQTREEIYAEVKKMAQENSKR